MGLDMYLAAKLYIPGYDHNSDEQKAMLATITEAVGLQGAVTPDSPSCEVSVNVAYWRKANAIHKWFVDNVQKGTDDCGDYYVGRDQLTALRGLCQKVLDTAVVESGLATAGTTYHSDGRVEQHTVPGRVVTNPEAVAAILPVTSGFFFGSTEYDEWYLLDVENTIEQIDRVLAAVPKGADADFYYHSSW
jgi:hypothetical protein